jgi:glycosyltransferase involved in cell wall biosynthesis
LAAKTPKAVFSEGFVSMPAVSVVMPSYNHESYICGSIESVLNQTFRDFELIIIDDGSKDRSAALITDYIRKDSRVKAIIHKDNRGIAKTVNDGLEAAGGDYVALASSDDLWMPEKLEKQMEILKENGNVVVWTEADVIDENDNDIGQLWTQRYKAEKRNKNGDIYFELLLGNFIISQSTIFRREAVKNIKYDTSLVYVNDYKFVLDLSKKYQYRFISEPLIKYRVHSGNISSRNSKLWVRDMIRLYIDELKHMGEIMPRKIRGTIFYRLSKYFLMRNRRKFSRYYLWQAVMQRPFKVPYLRHLFLPFPEFDSNNARADT